MSTSFEISEAKKADTATKLLIFGYIRNVNVMHKISDIIPDLISFVILLYFMEKEYFDKTCRDCQISHDKLSVTRIRGHNFYSTTYGKQWINSLSNAVVTWKIKITNKIPSNSPMIIGVTSRDDRQNGDFSDASVKHQTMYAFASNGSWSTANGYTNQIWREYMEFTQNDIITFILDLKVRAILFKVNEEEPNVIMKDIKTGENLQYKFAVVLHNKDDSIQLIDFSKE